MSSTLIRQHLEQSAEASADLQQKLRSLYVEWKTLKFKEEKLALKAAKVEKCSLKSVGHVMGESSANALTNSDKCIEQLNTLVDKGDSMNLDQQDINELERGNGLQVDVDKRIVGSDAKTPLSSLDQHEQSASLDNSSMDVNKCQSDDIEMNSVKNEILLLQKSITSIETELMKFSTRREFLGRDSFGRLYWILAESNSNVEFQQRGKIVCYSDDNPISSTWVFYQSDAEIKELVYCLKENDPRERELKESILHWQKLGFQGAQQTENRNREDPETVVARSTNRTNSLESCYSLITKATSLLETKYGPVFQPQATDSSKKRSRKSKLTTEQKMYRCECLEPVWQSRNHCISCHKTFFTIVELEKHNDGKCNLVPPTSERNKEDSDAVKGKGPKGETDTVDGLKSGCIRFQNNRLPCPFDFEEICSKFVIKSSNKELVKEIGLLGSNGIPSFVSSVSPYLSDPSLMLVPPQENFGVPKENLGSSVGNNMATVDLNDGSAADSSSKSAFKEPREAQKGDKAEGKDNKLLNSVMEVNCCVVPEASLRPLVGKASNILRQLKINLLDMDAVLTEEAIKPSKADSERRRAWCEFVKSAETIYEVRLHFHDFSFMIVVVCK